MARPSIDPAQRKLPKGVSLTQAEWDKFHRLGGSKWLARVLARAHRVATVVGAFEPAKSKTSTSTRQRKNP